jgi:ADP-ribosylation factor-binding protein GGA
MWLNESESTFTHDFVLQNLKSAEELESEDREAQAAKLQELIRRGTPRDLAAAQELMKSLAGANPESKPDYRSQALTDLNKLEQKVILMNEMLDNADTTRGEKFVAGDVYEVRYSLDQNNNIAHGELTASCVYTHQRTPKDSKVDIRCRDRRPRIARSVHWMPECFFYQLAIIDTFLQINDQINTVLNRYEAFKKGDYVTSSNPIPAELASGKNDLSLIDLDESMSPKVPSTSAQDELASLFGPSLTPANPSMPAMQPASQMYASPIPSMGFGGGMGGGISLPTNNAALPQPTMQPSAIRLSGTPPLQQLGSIVLPSTPQIPATIPNFLGGTGAATSITGMAPHRPQGQPQPLYQTQQQQPQQPSAQEQAQRKDPFADLVELF